MSHFRVRVVSAVARLLGVPIAIHQSFFVKGISSKRSGSVV